MDVSLFFSKEVVYATFFNQLPFKYETIDFLFLIEIKSEELF